MSATPPPRSPTLARGAAVARSASAGERASDADPVADASQTWVRVARARAALNRGKKVPQNSPTASSRTASPSLVRGSQPQPPDSPDRSTASAAGDAQASRSKAQNQQNPDLSEQTVASTQTWLRVARARAAIQKAGAQVDRLKEDVSSKQEIIATMSRDKQLTAEEMSRMQARAEQLAEQKAREAEAATAGMQQQLDRALRRMMQTQLYESFVGWWSAVQSRKRRNNLAKKAVMRIVSSSTSSAFARWYDYASKSKQEKNAVALNLELADIRGTKGRQMQRKQVWKRQAHRIQVRKQV
eukprot:SAG31_NODE_2131_length_6375_cov_5.937540_6_plen_299_part_00